MTTKDFHVNKRLIIIFLIVIGPWHRPKYTKMPRRYFSIHIHVREFPFLISSFNYENRKNGRSECQTKAQGITNVSSFNTLMYLSIWLHYKQKLLKLVLVSCIKENVNLWSVKPKFNLRSKKAKTWIYKLIQMYKSISNIHPGFYLIASRNLIPLIRIDEKKKINCRIKHFRLWVSPTIMLLLYKELYHYMH